MKKILVLGTNSADTDARATQLAQQFSLPNRGLISADSECVDLDGVYHTSLADLASGKIIDLAKRFDQIVMLDQSREQWSHWKLLQSTYKTMQELEALGYKTVFRTNQNIQRLEQMTAMVSDNPTWCIYPWIQFMIRDNTGSKLCARSHTNLSTDFSVDSWRSSTIRQNIQQRMLRGEKSSSCQICYDYESRGIESYRQYESRDWCNQLDIASIGDLDCVPTPVYYELHFGNKCNLKCRHCEPSRSSAIELEWQKHQIKAYWADPIIPAYPAADVIDINGLTPQSRVYVSGGEPVIMPETLELMQRCVDQERTDFELTMSTNGVKFPHKFIELSRHFSNLNLSFSLDGFGTINDYWRSGARWAQIVHNMHLMQDLGHVVTVNTVPGIYNVTNLHLLLQWLDQEFPRTSLYLQLNHNASQSAFNHPDHAAVIDSMRQCQKTQVYWSDGKSCRSCIDGILEHYESSPVTNWQDIRDFFELNDRLDRVRNTRLADHIPELEACRQHIPKEMI